jgi:hypothetical protein
MLGNFPPHGRDFARRAPARLDAALPIREQTAEPRDE